MDSYFLSLLSITSLYFTSISLHFTQTPAELAKLAMAKRAGGGKSKGSKQPSAVEIAKKNTSKKTKAASTHKQIFDKKDHNIME